VTDVRHSSVEQHEQLNRHSNLTQHETVKAVGKRRKNKSLLQEGENIYFMLSSQKADFEMKEYCSLV